MTPAGDQGSRFEFGTAIRVLFGAGTLKELWGLVSAEGRRALFVTGASPNRYQAAIDLLASAGVDVALFPISGEPTIDSVNRGAELARQHVSQVVVGLGGGSALDAAKAISALATNAGDVTEYLEVIGQARPLSAPRLPLILAPTTGGTGAEATRNAVLTAPNHRLKVSLRSPLLLPTVALIDPLLSLSTPPPITASTGLDALTQLIEAFVSVRANPMTDALCRAGIPRVVRSLRRAYLDGNDVQARTDLALASLWSGMALANAGLGAVHGLASPLGGRLGMPHGATCAALLPAVMETNLRVLRRTGASPGSEERYREIAVALTGRNEAYAEDGIVWVRELARSLQVKGLCHYGMQGAHFGLIAEKALAASSMKGNPTRLETDDLIEILAASL